MQIVFTVLDRATNLPISNAQISAEAYLVNDAWMIISGSRITTSLTTDSSGKAIWTITKPTQGYYLVISYYVTANNYQPANDFPYFPVSSLPDVLILPPIKLDRSTQPSTNKFTVTFQVYDGTTNKPIPNAQLQAFWNLYDASHNLIASDGANLTTDSNGNASWSIPYPSQGSSIVVGAMAYAQGYSGGYGYNGFVVGNIPSSITIKIAMTPLSQPTPQPQPIPFQLPSDPISLLLLLPFLPLIILQQILSSLRL